MRSETFSSNKYNCNSQLYYCRKYLGYVAFILLAAWSAATAVQAQLQDNILLSERNAPKPILVRENGAFKLELASTPPMGWNSWNTFRCEIDERVIRETVDSITSNGMKGAGYEYIVVDDCWQIGRDADGRLIADPRAFPSGIQALADYVHSRGLKFGIYSAAGHTTCAGRPGSKGYEWTDAKTFADWGVDYLKYDWCQVDWDFQSPIDSYIRMRDALVATGRDIVYSICEHGRSHPWRWGRGVGHLWRVHKDIRPCFDCVGPRATNGIMPILDHMARFQTFRYSGPGGWNDPDMLEVGNIGLNQIEAETHFGLWAMLAAPLFAGNDVRNLSEETLKILINKEVIAVNQDSLGSEAFLYRDYNNGTQVWRKWLSNADGDDGLRRDALLLLNRTDAEKYVEFVLDPKAEVRDLYHHKALGTFEDGIFRTQVPPHGSVMVLVVGMKKRT